MLPVGLLQIIKISQHAAWHNKCLRTESSVSSPRRQTFTYSRCYRSKRTSCSHLIPQDLLLSCTSCLSRRSIARVSVAPKRKVYYAVATIAHNGPLFWLDVAERSLVKHISSTIMSHPAISVPFYQLSCFAKPPALFPPPSSLVLAFTLHAGIIFISHQG